MFDSEKDVSRYDGFMDVDFEKIKAKSVNVEEKLGGRTQRPSFAPEEVRDKGEYKNYVGKNGDDE